MLQLLNQQSKKYQNLQGKLKRPQTKTQIEAFESSAPPSDKLDEKFQSLVKDYQYVQSQLATASGTYLDKLSSPYRNHFVSLSNGQQGYVTGENVFKPLVNNWAEQTTALPAGVGQNNWHQTGQILENSHPPMRIGTELTKGQSVVPTGQNVWVTKTVSEGARPPEFLGCYQSEPTGEITTTEACFQQAEQQAYQYIGLGKIDQVDKIICGLSNDLNTFTQPGEAADYDAKVVWSSQTQGMGNYAIFTVEGDLNVCNPNGDILYRQASPFPQCAMGGGVQQVVATYGGNCSVPPGNATQKVKDKAAGAPASLVFPVNNDALGDPAVGCPKAWDTSYQCGNQAKTAHLNYGEGQNFLYDCTQQVQACQNMRLSCQGDGSVQVSLDTTPSVAATTWFRFTLQKSNPNWEASKGKTATNYLLPTQTLFAEEWIGNTDGSLRMRMRNEGDLVFETASPSEGCSATQVYQRPAQELGNPSLLQHMGFVDGDAVLHEYPPEMQILSDQFYTYPQMTTQGTDLGEEKNNQSLEEMKQLCLQTPNCAGLVYNQVAQQGRLQTNAISSANFTPSNQDSIYLRIPSVSTKAGAGCKHLPLAELDSLQYSLFPKGEDMTPEQTCGMAQEIQPLRKQLQEISQQLNQVAAEMKTQIDRQLQRSEKKQSQFSENTHVMALNLAKNAEIQAEIARWQQYGSPMQEGFVPQQQQQEYKDSNLQLNQMEDTYYLWVLGGLAVIGLGWWIIRKRRDLSVV